MESYRDHCIREICKFINYQYEAEDNHVEYKGKHIWKYILEFISLPDTDFKKLVGIPNDTDALEPIVWFGLAWNARNISHLEEATEQYWYKIFDFCMKRYKSKQRNKFAEVLSNKK